MQNHLALEAHILSILDFIINNAQEDILNFLILDQQDDKITDFDFQVNPESITLSLIKDSGNGFPTNIVLNLKDEYTVDNIDIFNQNNFSSLVKAVHWRSSESLVNYIYKNTAKIETLWGYGGDIPFGSFRFIIFTVMKNIIIDDILKDSQFNRITEFLTNTLKSIGKE